MMTTALGYVNSPVAELVSRVEGTEMMKFLAPAENQSLTAKSNDTQPRVFLRRTVVPPTAVTS